MPANNVDSNCSDQTSSEMDERKLILLHVIFRHGQRTPDEITFYRKENETNLNEYYPYGEGQLTNKGKKDMYDLGKHLRECYNEFLGEIYLPKYVDAWSSEFDRTKTSLMLTLAGLYPPKMELVWSDELNWQPIPSKYTPAEKDMLFLGFTSKEYRKSYSKNFKNSDFGQKLMEDNTELLEYVKEHTGLEMYDTFQVMKLYDCVVREKIYNIHPEWATDSVIDKLRKIAHEELNVMMLETASLKRLLIGDLLEKIVHDSKNKIQGTSPRKIHLYAGHDVNLVGLLGILEVLKPHLPQEGACVVVELYSTSKGHEVEVKYRSNANGTFETLEFPEGETSWDFERLEDQSKLYCPKMSRFVTERKMSERLNI